LALGHGLQSAADMPVRWLMALSMLGIWGCEGAVGELGEYAPPEVVVSDSNGPKVLAFSCDATAVKAAFPVECTIQATHPEGEPVQCTLDLGDGRPPIELGECTVPRTATVRFAAPGRTTLTLTVTDATGRTSTRSVVIDVTGTPNQPPVLTDVVATPARGGAPLRTTLSWKASDPEGAPLRCDVELDGVAAFSRLDCAIGRQVLEVLQVGVHTVKLRATDGLDAFTEVSLPLEVLEPRGDVAIHHIDFGQSVVKQTLTLVADKPALLRVSVLGNEAGLAPVVEVEAHDGATSLGTLALTGPATAPLTEDLSDLTKQYRIVLPREWIVPGVRLTVRVDPTNAIPETDESNNEAVLTPTVSRGHVMHLTAVPVVQNNLTGTPRDVERTITDVWPFKGVEVKQRAPYTTSVVLSGFSGDAWGALLDELSQVKAVDGSSRNYYGFVKVNYGSGIAGIGYIGRGVATGRDDSLGTVAHELGHNLGRPHAPCGGVAGADPNYPYAGAKIGSWGWNGTSLLSPSRYVDLMSYCSPEWVSDYSYERVQQFISGRREFAPDAVLPDVRWTDAVLVAGRVLHSGEVRWAPVQRVRAAQSSEPVRGDAAVVLHTEKAQVVRIPVELHQTAEGDERHFVTVAPWVGALSAVELEVGGRVIGRRSASPFRERASAEAVRVDERTVRVRWTGGAWAAVAHLGAERTTLALAATGGELLVRVDGLDGGELEISVSDGVASSRLAVPMP
jgi:hypothetical protein